MITPLTVPYCSSYRYSIIYDACLLVCHFWRTHLPDADMRGTPETGGGQSSSNWGMRMMRDSSIRDS